MKKRKSNKYKERKENMGQYYTFFNIDKKMVYNPSGLKLMEHSYLGNPDCLLISALVKDKWKGDRVIQVGDYVDGTGDRSTAPFEEALMKELELMEKDKDGYSKTIFYDFPEMCEEITEKYINKIGQNFTYESDGWGEMVLLDSNSKKIDINDVRYMYNTVTKEYIDTFKVPTSAIFADKNNEKIYLEKVNAHSLLIACGNGLGGGDYFGPDKEMVGHWAPTSQNIIISEKSPSVIDIDLTGWTEIVPAFTESKASEIELLREFLEAEVAEGKDIQKYYICPDGVYMPKILQCVLKKIQDKYK